MHQKQRKMTLKQRAKRIAEIDIQLSALFEELHSLYRDGLTTEEHNKLWEMVMSDGEPHWS